MDLKISPVWNMKEMPTATHSRDARVLIDAVDASEEFSRFVAGLKVKFPWRFEMKPDVLERDYLRIVKHHLDHLIPQVQRYMDPLPKRVLDFGCGSGGSSIAMALVYPEVHFYGTDIDPMEIEVAKERAALYGVSDRCEFKLVEPGQTLPVPQGSFDFLLCSSMLEYAVEDGVREFCVREMVRAVSTLGLLFFSVPNRLYPYEIHTGKWGWNYFPRWFCARTVDSGFWEVQRLARPSKLSLYRSRVVRLLTPWTTFCLRKEHD